MALTTPQKLSIARILGLTPAYFDAHLSTLTVSADLETAIVAELTRWTSFGSKFTKIHPMANNYGVEIDPEKAKRDIRDNLRMLLEMPYLQTSSSMGTIHANA